MKISSAISTLMMALVIASCDGNAQINDTDLPIVETWAENGLWDDGKAEVALYDAERVVYGEARRFEYVYVLVKETFNESYNVKTDDYQRGDLYPIMKVNKFCRIETQKYPYHYLTSIFFKRDNPYLVHKLTNTSQEWCGNTAKSYVEKGSNYEYQYMSYWDGQGNGLTKVNKGPWFEDQLSYTLRSVKFDEGLSFTVNMYPSQITSQANVPQAEEIMIEVSRPSTSDLIAIDSSFIKDPWKVKVSRMSGSNLTYWINGTYPNTLLKMQSSDGRKLTIKSLERDDYWISE